MVVKIGNEIGTLLPITEGDGYGNTNSESLEGDDDDEGSVVNV